MGKTVYILGAGFSKSAGAPLQSEIIRDIYSVQRHDLNDLDYKDLFFEYREVLSYILSEIFYAKPEQYADFPLEDIFTSIDKCIIDNISLRHFSKEQLLNIRQKINALIAMLMDYKLKSVISFHITQFATYLIKKKRDSFVQNKKDNPFSIISTNWDIIIENFIKRWMNNNEEIDYCFEVYPYSLQESEFK